MRQSLLTVLLTLLCLAGMCRLAAGEGLTGTSARIYVILNDDNFVEGQLMFSKYEMKVTGPVASSLGLTGGDYKRGEGKDAAVVCMVKAPSASIASISWSVKVSKGDDKAGTGASASGTVTVTPADPKKKATTLKIEGDRPRPKR